MKNKDQYAVYEKVAQHGKDNNGIILAPYDTIAEAEQAKVKYGYTSINYYVDKIIKR